MGVESSSFHSENRGHITMHPLTPTSPRILLVDDNRAIHDDFRKILSPSQASVEELAEAEAMLFGTETRATPAASFQIESAYQGADAIRLVEQSLAEGRPYA